ncbi:unnamed protein product [marine sediment metagenome]|uniref:Uncharacterized protein n=1 Tax=marine sediment metagenome TaxID=412755 RepID=X0VM44_9ZZZZ
MKIEEIITETTDSVIKQTVDAIRQDIRSFNGAVIDGRASVLNVRGKQVSKTLGVNLDALAAHESESAWVHKNGRDNYSLGYKK